MPKMKTHKGRSKKITVTYEETSSSVITDKYRVGDKVFMLDPASNETDMWKKYDWNLTTQFVYFKANK